MNGLLEEDQRRGYRSLQALKRGDYADAAKWAELRLADTVIKFDQAAAPAFYAYYMLNRDVDMARVAYEHSLRTTPDTDGHIAFLSLVALRRGEVPTEPVQITVPNQIYSEDQLGVFGPTRNPKWLKVQCYWYLAINRYMVALETEQWDPIVAKCIDDALALDPNNPSIWTFILDRGKADIKGMSVDKRLTIFARIPVDRSQRSKTWSLWYAIREAMIAEGWKMNESETAFVQPGSST